MRHIQFARIAFVGMLIIFVVVWLTGCERPQVSGMTPEEMAATKSKCESLGLRAVEVNYYVAKWGSGGGRHIYRVRCTVE